MKQPLFDVLIVIPAHEKLQRRLYHGPQQTALSTGDKKATLILKEAFTERSIDEGLETYREDCTLICGDATEEEEDSDKSAHCCLRRGITSVQLVFLKLPHRRK